MADVTEAHREAAAELFPYAPHLGNAWHCVQQARRTDYAQGLADKETRALAALKTALDGLPDDGSPVHLPMFRLVLEAVAREVRGG